MAPALIQEVVDESPGSHKIQLNDTESTLRRLFLDVAQYIEQTIASQQPIVLRFTGGWVRDKLLGVPSHDIDVAINNMTGLQFGQKMLEYLETPGNPEKYGLDGVATTEKQDQSAAKADKSKTVRGLHKIAANPEKSKHLETVATSVLGIDIDLVNLRKETYDEESRNPQMHFGTPEEDALRRDATVNAMFYNLNTQELEDFTGQGMADMREKILRTPLEAYQTFRDDPLRVLRLIRFASRLGWSIDASATQAMQHPDIKASLRKKISRERVGIELEKALHGPDPHHALCLILKLGLYSTIFSDPAIELSTDDAPSMSNAFQVIDHLESIILDPDSLLCQIAVRDADERFLAWQLAALIPYRNAPFPEPAAPGRKAPPPIASQVAREGIKATSKTCDLITASVRNLRDIQTLVDAFHDETIRKRPDSMATRSVSTRDYLGMKIRLWGANWRSQFIFALLAAIADNNPEQADVHTRRYANLLERLRELDVLDAYLLKPLLDGKTLAKALGTAPGPWMKDALDVVMAWQLCHPGQTDTQEAIEEVKKQGELALSLAEHFLKLTIRPLFIKTKPANITEQGRKKAFPQHAQKTVSFDDAENRPWKDAENKYALSLLRWTTQTLNEQSVQQYWPMLIPPVLTLIDDWETRYKELGADLLAHILAITPTELLKRTGLGPVFEEALLPCLAYLPTLTEEQQTLELLPAVYRALLGLANARFPVESSALGFVEDRVVALDSIVRKGIIYGFTHTSQRPTIVTMLIRNLVILINALGIDFIKHLKFVLPMLKEVLSNPLASARPELLQSAVASVQAVVQNCWPRMIVHRGEILAGLTLCWLNLDGQHGVQVQSLRKELQSCVTTLQSAVGDQVDLGKDFGLLIEADERLRGLFTS